MRGSTATGLRTSRKNATSSRSVRQSVLPSALTPMIKARRKSPVDTVPRFFAIVSCSARTQARATRGSVSTASAPSRIGSALGWAMSPNASAVANRISGCSARICACNVGRTTARRIAPRPRMAAARMPKRSLGVLVHPEKSPAAVCIRRNTLSVRASFGSAMPARCRTLKCGRANVAVPAARPLLASRSMGSTTLRPPTSTARCSRMINAARWVRSPNCFPSQPVP